MVQKSKTKKRDTIYFAKVAVLAALAYALHLWRIPIFPVAPFNVLELDFSYIPSLLGGFSLGPIAAVLIEVIKNGVKMLSTGSSTFYVGDLSNLIVSLSFVLPASIFYRYRKTFKGALAGLLIGYFAMLLISSLSNYFIIVPMYAAFSPAIMDVRALFAFGYGLAFNAIKGLVNAIIVVLIYKRLSPILHLNIESLKEKSIYKVHLVPDEKATIELGTRLSKKLKGGETVFLHGELGAGKTTFTKGIAKGLGILDEILSPTFILMKTYVGRLTLNHIDMYRLDEGTEIDDLGLEDVLYKKGEVTVIEWNKMTDIKGKIIFVDFQYTQDNGRQITISNKNVK